MKNLKEIDFKQLVSESKQVDVTSELEELAKQKKPIKGKKIFDRLFFEGGEIVLKSDVKGTWKEDAWKYARALMNSYKLEHNQKQLVCGMIFEECLELTD